jgi:hypothetical protein
MATRTDDTYSAGDNEEDRIAGGRESQTCCGHENRADDQHAPPPNAIRSGGQVERDDDIANESQRKN